MQYFQLTSGTVISTSTPEHWNNDPNAKKLSRAKGKEILRSQAKAELLKTLKPGDTIQCVLRHVSSSGMSRTIDFFKLENGSPIYLTEYIANLLDYSRDKRDGLLVRGGGMDMGFSVVYNLSRALFQGNFQCIGENCPSNDHSNGDRNREPHQHSDGGYAIRHHWL